MDAPQLGTQIPALLLKALPPLHLLAYSTLLGTTLYHTFIITKVTFHALPRSAFTTLQRKLFPAYFRCQTGLLVLTAVTIPRGGAWTGALIGGSVAQWAPFVIAGVTALLNLVVFGPGTRKAMVARIHQETREGGRKAADEEVSMEMKALNRVFRRQHAMSIHLNLICAGAIVWWGVRLGSQLQP